MIRAAALILTFTSFACASSLAASRPCGGGAPEPWCTGQFHGPAPSPPPPSTPESVRDTMAALARACPAPRDDDPTPGLSSGARSIKWPVGRIHVLPVNELQGLLQLLEKTPKDSPDRPKIMARLASTSFLLERFAHRDCRDLAAQKDLPAERWADFERQARTAVKVLYTTRAYGTSWCTALVREHPDAIPAWCAR